MLFILCLVWLRLLLAKMSTDYIELILFYHPTPEGMYMLLCYLHLKLSLYHLYHVGSIEKDIVWLSICLKNDWLPVYIYEV